MKWHQGHNPDLVITDDHGRDRERHDITELNYDGIHQLLQTKGFVKKEEL